MDATPVTLGQEFGGYAAQIRSGIERIEASLPRTRRGAARRHRRRHRHQHAARASRSASSSCSPADTGLPITEARRPLRGAGRPRRRWSRCPGQLRTIAVSLTKICNDLRWMGSGPRTGLAEIHLPDLQPGSSIMPGKVNPVLPEATLMVVRPGHRQRRRPIAFAGASGTFELNVMLPVIGRNLLESMRLLGNASRAARRPLHRRHHRRRRALPRASRVVARRS